MPTSPVRDTLLRYSQNRASTDEVMRALMLHADWQVPVGLASAVTGEPCVVPRMVVYGQQADVPAGELWLFTDDEAAQAAVAKGGLLGSYAAGLPGVRVFAAVDARIKKVKVNIGSDPSQFWFIGEENFLLMRIWAGAVGLDLALRDAPAMNHPPLLKALRAFGGYMVLLHPNHAIVTAVGAAGFQNPALVFTAPDCLKRCLESMPAQQVDTLKQVVVNGADLFAQMPNQGVDGMLFNPMGPGTVKALPLAACAAVLGAK